LRLPDDLWRQYSARAEVIVKLESARTSPSSIVPELSVTPFLNASGLAPRTQRS
jgi:hypothetical protein